MIHLSVREAFATEVDDLAKVLSESLCTDPLMRWILPSQEVWSNGSRDYFALSIRWFLRGGRVFTMNRVECVALWLPPGRRRRSLRLEGEMASQLVSLIGWWRSFKVGRLERNARRKLPRVRHWFLHSIGVAPSEQGRGVGSALVSRVLEECDRAQIAACVYSANQKNFTFYQRLGFREVEELQIGSAPTIWILRRDSQTPGRSPVAEGC